MKPYDLPPPPSGRKDDAAKPDYSLLPAIGLDEIVRVLTFGAGKYGRDNWRMLADLENRYKAAAGRHWAAMLRGELVDPESGLLHSAHLGSCALFLAEVQMAKKGTILKQPDSANPPTI